MKDFRPSFWFLLIAALIFYAQHVWVPGLFQDAYLYAGLMEQASKGHLLISHLAPMHYNEYAMHPPFLFALQAPIVALLPKSFVSVRLLALVWGLAILFGLAWFIRREGKHPTWWYWSGLVLVFMPPFIKLSRFPNLDVPLTLFVSLAFFSYYAAYSSWKGRTTPWWYLTGFFFGCALLSKGPSALSIPAGIFLHIALTSRWRLFLSPHPWIALVAGFGMFGLWPLALHLKGRMDLFNHYFYHQVYGSAYVGRQRTEWNLHVYVWHLIKFSAPWFLFSLYALYRIARRHYVEKVDQSLPLLFAAWFLVVLVPYSFVKLKYSHYIIPLYPAYAALAGYAIADFSLRVHLWIQRIVVPGVVAAGLAFLIFPISTTQTRDVDLQTTLELTSKLSRIPDVWVNVNEATGVYPFLNYLSWWGEKTAMVADPQYVKTLAQGAESEKRFVLFMRPSDVVASEALKRFRPLVAFGSEEVILVDKTLMPDDRPLLQY